MRLTGSSFGRAELCAPSTFLPRIEETLGYAGERGRAIHSYLLSVALKGREEALLDVHEDFREDCEAIEIDALPHATPEAWAVEVGLAWDWEADTAREMFRSADSRDYSSRGPNEVCGTADVLGVTADAVVVLDVKTGYAPLGPPDQALQLLFYAVAAARAYGKSSAIIGWIRLRDGQPYFERAYLGMFELDMAAARMRDVVDAARAAEARFTADPATLAPVVGRHCTYCPAFRVCPANATLLRELALVGDGKPELPVLTNETAALVWVRAHAAQKVLDLVMATVKTFAESHPFDLPSGERVGVVPSTREKLDALVAKPVLQRLSPAVAEAAIDIKESMTKAGLTRALKANLPAGRKLTPYVTEVLGELKRAGAVQAETYYSVKPFKPQKQLEPQEAEQAG